MDTPEQKPKNIDQHLTLLKADRGFSQIEGPELTEDDLRLINTHKGLVELLKAKQIDLKNVVAYLQYEQELRLLQIEMIKLQRDVENTGRRVVIVFEGRDAAGKGGTIRRFTEHLNPRPMRIIALPKPSDVEKGQWYFQRYVNQLPNPGEICFFDRSWYNRAVVEPVMDFCTPQEYEVFLRQVPEFEHMLFEDNIEVIKFWFSISKEEQARRFTNRKVNPLKQWKLSLVDEMAQLKWDLYTHYKEEMFSKTHNSYSPWIIVQANNKKKARLESMRYVLSTLNYAGKGENNTVSLLPNPNVVMRFHRSVQKID